VSFWIRHCCSADPSRLGNRKQNKPSVKRPSSAQYSLGLDKSGNRLCGVPDRYLSETRVPQALHARVILLRHLQALERPTVTPPSSH
jgi:hypothetical protein